MSAVTSLKKKLLNLLKEDEEFRYAVAGLLGLDTILSELRKLREDFNRYVELEEKRWEENAKRWEENARRWEENARRWEENNKRWEENAKRWEENNKRWEENARRWEENNKRWEENAKRWEENNKRWEENNKKWEEAYRRFEVIENELKALREDFNKAYLEFSRRLDALGARWGVVSEEAFREGMRGVVEKILGVAKIDRWVFRDEGGEVYGYPSIVEADVVVKDSVHALVEVKSSISKGDVLEFWRIGKLYERVTGFKPRLVMISPYVDEKAFEAATKLGIELYTKLS